MIARTKDTKERMKLSVSQAKMRDQRAGRPRRMGRTFEAAATTGYNIKHWLKADARDVTTIVTEALPVLRNRCRYETRNNSWALGAVTTLADAVAGTGPRLQVLSESKRFNKSIEDRFSEWSGICDMRGLLDLGRMIRLGGALQQCDSGESFIVLNSRPRDRFPVKLRLFMVESDRVATPFEKVYDITVRDGIELDKYGKPIAYWIRESHPGNYLKAGLNKATRVPAENVIHLYRQSRPGQTRGIPLLTPALMPLAQLRDFTHNTMVAADVVARLSGVLEAAEDMRVDTDESYEAFDAVELETGTFTTLPSGFKLSQLRPEQPSATYEMFVAAKLKEAGRALNMPFNVIAGDSSKYNYASGRLDKQNWWKYIEVFQAWLAAQGCEPIFRAWLREALLIPGYIEMGGLSLAEAMAVIIDWFWPGIEHVDPQKEAKAQDIRTRNFNTTYATEYARRGKDWEKEFRQIAREQKLMNELGLSLVQVSTSGDKCAGIDVGRQGR